MKEIIMNYPILFGAAFVILMAIAVAWGIIIPSMKSSRKLYESGRPHWQYVERTAKEEIVKDYKSELLTEFGFWILHNEKEYDLTTSIKDTVGEFLESKK